MLYSLTIETVVNSEFERLKILDLIIVTVLLLLVIFSI